MNSSQPGAGVAAQPVAGLDLSATLTARRRPCRYSSQDVRHLLPENLAFKLFSGASKVTALHDWSDFIPH